MRMLRGLLSALFCLVAATAFAADGDLRPIPPLTAHVTDLTGTLDVTQKQSLEDQLAALEKSKGSQLAVLIVPTTQPEDIEQYSIRVVDAWKLGRKNVDDGVLLIVAKDDHKMRIEVGRGLEGAIPDAAAARIIREYITPRFRAGDFNAGIQDGVGALTKLINDEPLPPPWTDPNAGHKSSGSPIGAVAFILIWAAFFFSWLPRPVRAPLVGVIGAGAAWMISGALVYALGFGVAGLLLGALIGSIGGGGFASGGGWGGFGGGGGFSSGGGGFSGGGGGFSGGGASGSW